MAIHIRRKIGENMRMKKRLKFPITKVVEVLPFGFSDEDVVSLFKVAYPGLWLELKARHTQDNSMFKNRVARGLKAVKPLSPNQLLLLVAKPTINKERNSYTIYNQCTEDNKKIGYEKLERKGKAKLSKIAIKGKARKREMQDAAPQYIDNLITEYFKVRKENTLDINSRYLIILECAKFKCKKTIIFLEKINACEKNDQLRMLAFKSLQRFGLSPSLGRKRKGKKKLSIIGVCDLDENPTELLQYIYSSQHKIHQKFDVFLSHSYGRQQELLAIKEMLNRQGMVVYVDWINDAEMMRREKQNSDTFKVLNERLSQSSTFLFIQTKESLESKYCMDEVDFFKNMNRPMFIYEVDKLDKNSRINDFVSVSVRNDKLCIDKDGIDIPLCKSLIMNIDFVNN